MNVYRPKAATAERYNTVSALKSDASETVQLPILKLKWKVKLHVIMIPIYVFISFIILNLKNTGNAFKFKIHGDKYRDTRVYDCFQG